MSLVVFTIIMVFGVVLALGYAAINFFTVKRMDEGNERMQEIAAAIRLGASTFINYEYRVVGSISAVLAVILAILISWQMAVAFVIGAIMSATAGFVGMKIATYSNVRVTNTAEKTRNLAETLKIAYRGGSVMGLSVGGFAMLGIIIVYLVFGQAMGQLDTLIAGHVTENWWGMPVTFTVTLSGYALGCSIIAMFNRVGGGIYTKAADMAADLVGKTEYRIPEDDPRNPATIADNVGDNVGDIAGLGADLLESYVGAILSAVILALEMFRDAHLSISEGLVHAMIHFPLVFAIGGLIACVLGIASLLVKRKLSESPHRELNLSTWISATLTIVFGVLIAWILFSEVESTEIRAAGFAAGWISPLLASAMGVLSGIIVGVFAEYYTSYSFKPTKMIAEATREGVGLTITGGLSVGMKSTLYPSITLSAAIASSYLLAGMYGVAMAATGMLSFIVTTVSVDSYGPIADNAGGIAEMSFLDDEVRQITDTLDAVGNTTAAIGKGFAIGSAALAALSMMTSYLYSFTPPEVELILNAVHPMTLVGMIVGAAFPWMFAGMLIDSVVSSARIMVVEVRRQFREIKGLLEGKVLPDYESCISIASKGALREMRKPAIVSVVVPIVCGLLFGPFFVAGLLLGSTLSAVTLALFSGNVGGAWDNAKKFIEIGGVEGVERNTPEHDAAIVGDTVGDPLKDTVGPSLNILIKIMAVVSLVMGSIFAKYNLVDWIRTLIG